MKTRSARLEDLVQSDIRRMTRECDRVGGINLGQGVCDLPTPAPVRDAAIAAIQGRKSLYSYPEGIPELRAVIARKLAEKNGIEADPASEIAVTVGATGAFAAVLHGLLDPGDGLLVFEPYYGYHLNAAILAGLEPHFCALAPPDFPITEEGVRAALRPNTRAIVVCTPSNPSGKMWTVEELETLARVAHEHDLLVITDEIYEDITYDDRVHVSPATIGGLAERTVTIMGLSKTFSITGWRLGYAVARPELLAPITLACDLLTVCAPTPLQHGVAAGFGLPQSFYDDLKSEYAHKRAVLCDALEAAGMQPIRPQGAYYVLADVGHWGFATAREAALHLLESAGVAAVPGSAFYRGAEGERLLRFCYASELERIQAAAARIVEFGGAQR
ncbi:MAG: pyridoxal phosphate-dependent aminotransferase [Planctomycetes bacterium]|nr:pyridoxal phosphate-dependent aminotransferase [Planctomycetota bacterium]